jgi:hypothetical protein
MRGQFWSFDVIFGLVIFGIAISILMYVWFTISSQFAVTNSYGIEGMQLDLQSLQAALLSQGSPSSWSSEVTVSNTLTWSELSIGLLNSSETGLSPQKIATLEGMSNANYPATKQLLGVAYDYFITIKTGSTDIQIGSNPADYNATAEQVATTPVTVSGRQAEMQVIVWTNTSFGIG